MAHVAPALVAETGTLASGVVTVAGAVANYRTFATALADGDTVDVVIKDAQGDQASYPASIWDETAGTLTLGSVDVSTGTITDGAVTVWAATDAPELSKDTTPQLGGDLDCNGNAVLFDDYVEKSGTISFSATPTFPVDGGVYAITLTGDITSISTSGTAPSASTIYLTQDATGSRTVAWPAAWKWPDGAAFAMPSTASAVAELSLRTDPSGTVYASAVEMSTAS